MCMKNNDSIDESPMDEFIDKKLEKIIQQTRTENEALRKILIGLEKLSENPDKDIGKLKD